MFWKKKNYYYRRRTKVPNQILSLALVFIWARCDHKKHVEYETFKPSFKGRPRGHITACVIFEYLWIALRRRGPPAEEKRKPGWNASAAFKWSQSKEINSGGKLNLPHGNTSIHLNWQVKIQCISWTGSVKMKWTPTGSSTIALYGYLLMLCLCVCRYWVLTTGTPLELDSISPHTNMFTSIASTPQWHTEMVRNYK